MANMEDVKKVIFIFILSAFVFGMTVITTDGHPERLILANLIALFAIVVTLIAFSIRVITGVEREGEIDPQE